MKIILYFIFCALCAPSIYSQTSFDIIFSNEYVQQIGWTPVIDENSNYYFPFTETQPNQEQISTTWSGIYKINTNGEFIDSLRIPFEEGYRNNLFGGVLLLINDTIYCIGNRRETSTNIISVMGYKIDLELNIIDSININLPGNYFFYIPKHIEYHDDKLTYTLSYFDTDIPSAFFNGILMVDIPISFSTYTYTANLSNEGEGWAWVDDFVPFNNKFILATQFWDYNFIGNQNNQNISLAIFDNELNPVSTSNMDTFHFMGDNDIDVYQDSLLLISGKKRTHFNPDDVYFGRDLGVFKLDSNFNILDSIVIFTAPYSDTLDISCSHCMDQFDENNIYFGSIKNASNQFQLSNHPSWIRLVKLDADLNIIWEKFYGGERANFIKGIKATPDGGCIMLCEYYDYEAYPDVHKTDLRIIKVDADGLVTGIPEEGGLLIKSLLLYPSPSSGHVSIETALRDYSIQFFTSGGQLAWTSSRLTGNQEMDLNHLANGVYFYTVVDRDGKKLDDGKLVMER